jgi:hypothetical protein
MAPPRTKNVSVTLLLLARSGGPEMSAIPPLSEEKQTFGDRANSDAFDRSGPRLLRVEGSAYLQVFEAATTRFQDGLHFTKSGGIFRQRDRGVEMVNAVMFHAED